MDPNLHLIERRERRGKRLSSIALLAVIAVLGASLYGIFAFLESNAAFGTVEDVADSVLCNPNDYDLTFPAIGSLSEVWTSDGVLLGSLTERNSQPVAIDDIPAVMKAAIVSAEDGGFYQHKGIDFKAIVRAALENARSGNLQGGSTITQQIVKKVFLTDERTLDRKICEAVVAAELERRYTKDQILEFYMNSQFFGANAYGVKAAAQEYFGKDLSDITIAEAATIAVPIRNPTVYNIRDNTATVVKRRNSVIEQMQKNGFITAAEAAAAIAEPLTPVPHQEFVQRDPRILIEAKQRILADPKYGLGDTYTARKQALFGCPASDAACEGGGGLKITVTVNYEQQQEASRILRSWFRDSSGPTGAIAMVENATGAIRVIASGLEFGTDLAAGQRPYDLATKGRRQAGSSFKPFALIAGLEHGSLDGKPITLGSYWDYTSPQKIDCGYPCSPQGNIWTVRNAGGGGVGIRTLEQATYLSTNTVFAQVSLAVGPENIVDTAHKMGIVSPLNPVLSIALGTQAVSPLEMASAYSTIANYGERIPSYLIETIADAAGNIIYQHEPQPERVLNQALTAAVVRTLRKVVSQGTARRADIGRPQAGKTGTAQNFRDVWFMGFIPQYTTAVWVGYADAQIEMVNFTVYDERTGKEQFHRRAYGGTVAAPVWKDFMLYVTKNLPVEDFPPEPDGTNIYFRVPSTEVPDILEMTEEDAVDAIYKAGLDVTVEEVASAEEKGTILEVDPAVGSKLTQGKSITLRVSNGQPPELIDLRLLNLADVDAAITAFNEQTGLGLTWVVVNQPTTEPTVLGRVINTNPPPGAVVEPGQVITVIIGVPPGPGP